MNAVAPHPKIAFLVTGRTSWAFGSLSLSCLELETSEL